MAFGSIIFICIFLPAFILGIYVLPEKIYKFHIKDWFIICASLIFYRWGCGDNKYLALLILGFCGINYFLAFCFTKIRGKKWSRLILSVAVVGNISVLFLFKYLVFTAGIFGFDLRGLGIIMPLGLSFIVFQAISYLVDIYRGDAEIGNIRSVLLYISFFPKVISGPIIRYTDFSDSFKRRKVSLDLVYIGIQKITIGLAKKVIIADTLGVVVDQIYTTNLMTGIDTPTAWLGSIAYAMQIYFDFSGYSDIALGICNLMGLKFRENFNYPYLASSVTDFWRRWHISLGNWFKHYIYFPLGGSRKGNVYLNLFVVFLVTGIWHGASWTFILWGVIYGVIRMFEKLVENKTWYKKIPKVFCYFATMLIVNFNWVLFRADDLDSAFRFIGSMIGLAPMAIPDFQWQYYFTPSLIIMMALALILSTVPGLKTVKKFTSTEMTLENKGITIIKTFGMVVLLVLVYIFLTNSSYNPFIYFQF